MFFYVLSIGNTPLAIFVILSVACSFASHRVKTALSLAKQFNRKDHVVVLETLYHVRISFWVEPLQATCQALNDMHSDALLEGQIEFAMAGSLQSFRRSLFCGNELTKVSNDAKLIGKEMV